ncbi:MAG: 50S ribosomal protein L10 [Verrucomicrobia bacterium]|nr:50S ribosomal protein L10 [Verrucomicrobiota bacterium]MBS0645600.1 50S ribosomal protein L10 [Verrucomicrobiota bacterium]
MREEKQLLLDDLADKIRTSKGFVVAQYKDFSATRSRDFRNQLAKIGAEFEVVRKRVFIKAAEATGVTLNSDSFSGHIAVIFANEDPTITVKSTVKYAEDNANTILPLGGHLDGAVCSKEDLAAIAKLPNLPEMRAQFLGLLQAPMAQTLGALQAILASPLYCLDEKSKQS